MSLIFEEAHKYVVNVKFKHYLTGEPLSLVGTSCPEKTIGYGVCVRQDPKSSSIALFDVNRKKWDAIRVDTIMTYEVIYDWQEV